MKLQEDKAAEVRERWTQIQLQKNLRKAVDSLKSTNVKPVMRRENDTRPAMTQGQQDDMVKKVMDIAKGDNNVLTPEEKEALELKQRRDRESSLEDLKTIEWFGKVAVGESRSFPGWWKVVPPVGFAISYMGKTAQEQARAQARMIREWYE
jgi:hypothetical protein